MASAFLDRACSTNSFSSRVARLRRRNSFETTIYCNSHSRSTQWAARYAIIGEVWLDTVALPDSDGCSATRTKYLENSGAVVLKRLSKCWCDQLVEVGLSRSSSVIAWMSLRVARRMGTARTRFSRASRRRCGGCNSPPTARARPFRRTESCASPSGQHRQRKSALVS
jgi:hypothetical protein